MKRWMLVPVVVLAVMGVLRSMAAEPAAGDLAGELRALLLSQIQAKQAEDLEAAFKDVVLPPRQRERTMELFRQVFGRYDLLYTLDGFQLLGSDGEVAVARFQQTLRGVRAEQFRDNQRDALQVFRKVDGHWKIHEQVILDTILLNPTPSTQPAPTTRPAVTP